jgi:PKD repeat protein
VEQKPVADFTFVNAQFGFTYDFTSTSQGATSYFWDFGDGSGTSTSANPSYTYFFPGDYEVTLVVENACGTDSLKVRVNGVNIEDELFGGMIRLYPNPTKGEFFLVADEFQSEELSIEVTDVRGRLVYIESQRNVFGGFQIRVDLSGEAEGVYQVKISDGTRTAYKRVVKE